MIKLIGLFLAATSTSLIFAEQESFGLDYNTANYNFTLPSAADDSKLNFFDDCADHRGLADSSSDRITHITAIHKDGSRIVIPVDSDSTGSN